MHVCACAHVSVFTVRPEISRALRILHTHSPTPHYSPSPNLALKIRKEKHLSSVLATVPCRENSIQTNHPDWAGFLNHLSCTRASFFNLSGVMVPVTQLFFKHQIRGYFSSLLRIPRLTLAGIKGIFSLQRQLLSKEE